VILLFSILSTALGVGSFALLPLFSIHFGAKESIALLTVYFLFQNINKAFLFFRYIDWKVSVHLIVWSLPGVAIGTFALIFIPIVIFKKVLGVGILFFLLKDLLPESFSFYAHSKNLVPLFGVFYGFSSGILGSGNMVKGPLFSSLGIFKERYIATYTVTSLFMNLPKLIIYSSAGLITTRSCNLIVPLLIVSVIGTYIGKIILSKISNLIFSSVIRVVFIISACYLLVS
jgi:hypothetical protein